MMECVSVLLVCKKGCAHANINRFAHTMRYMVNIILSITNANQTCMDIEKI